MSKFETTDYLIVNVSDPLDEKIIGCKCIPATWAEKNDPQNDNDLLIRYPEEENSETETQIKNKEPSQITWPFYCGLLMFRTESYEEALEFITENDRRRLAVNTAKEQPDTTMNRKKPCETPSTSLKRGLPEDVTKNPANDNNILPKKTRKSDISSLSSLNETVSALGSLIHNLGPVTSENLLELKKEPFIKTYETPSTSLKRGPPEDNDKNTTNDDILGKKTHESAMSSLSLNEIVSALGDLIRNLAPTTSENGTENYSAVDIKHVVDIYVSILEVRKKLKAEYMEKRIKLRRAFQSINFIPFVFKKQQIKIKHAKSIEAKRIKPIIDSKWTLEHEGPGPGLTELMPDSGIYVHEQQLGMRRRHATNMKQLATLLLPLIFSNKAFIKCSYTGMGRNGKPSTSKDTLPGLDEHARKILMAFVTNHAQESGWEIVSPKVMTSSLTQKLRDIRWHSYGRRNGKFESWILNHNLPESLRCDNAEAIKKNINKEDCVAPKCSRYIVDDSD